MKFLMKENLEKLIVLLLILMSGSIYFSHSTLLLAFILASIIYLIIFSDKRIVISKYNFFVMGFFTFVLLLHVLLTINYNIPISDIRQIIIYILILVIVQSNMLKSSFINKYINIITLICLISLVCSFLVNVMSISSLPFQKIIMSSDGLTFRVATPYYTMNVQNEFGIIDQERNSGLFWEPGAFQAFISLAILLLINKLKDVKKSDAAKILILMITLLTTQSTTGYVIFILLIIYLMFNLKRVNKNAKYMLMFLLMSIVSVIVINFQMIQDIINYKLINKNGSYSTRVAVDSAGGFQQFLEKFVMGYGYNSEFFHEVSKAAGIVNNSNGIVIMLMSCGLFVSVPYFILLFKGLKHIFESNIINLFIILVIFIIIHSTQWFIFKPMFLALLFKWKTTPKESELETLQDTPIAKKRKYRITW
ncbi:hypothetical protein GTW56_14180 [Bacillus sp. EB93]|nr:hypothetical protein [Peribacillus frigoritolerans]